MLSSYSTISILEDLPNEILLLICRYLSSTDILFSFYGLNSRLSQTISGYCQHIVLAEVPFAQFNYICTSILPKIGANICSLVIDNSWKGVLSTSFLSYFDDKMSLVFPCLKQLILSTFRIGTLISFLDCLQNLPELFELKIVSLYDMGVTPTGLEILLSQIFTANNNRLTTISFDDDSLSFPYEIQNDVCYSHIEKLVIELKTLNDLHRLLIVLPQLKFMDVAINEECSEVQEDMQYLPILTLRHFRLRSFVHSWNLHELESIFKRIPNVQELIVQISSHYDIRLIDGQQMFSHLSSLPLKKFSYFLQLDNSSALDHTNVISSWKQFKQEFICIKSDDDDTIVLYTLPFNCPYLFLRCPVAKNKTLSDSYGAQVRCLTLYEVTTRIAETFSIIAKCYRIRDLVLRIGEELVPNTFQSIHLNKLRYLTFFAALERTSVNADDFIKLLEVSPNLYHLTVSYEFIQPLLDNESVCYFLKYRITHLLIRVTSIANLASVTISISRLTIVFPRLKHLYFHIEIDNESAESLILSIFNHLCQWSFLVSFGVANITMDSKILTKDLRQWVLENSSLNANQSFLIDYSEEIFRLWL